MKVLKRLCQYDQEVVDGDKSLVLKRGAEYITSPEPDANGDVTVFSTYWAKVPVKWFCAPVNCEEGDAVTLEQLAKQTARDIWGVRPDKQEQIILAALKAAERKGQLDVVAQIDARCNNCEEAMCIADEFEEIHGRSV